MELAALLTAPVIATAVALVIASAWIGHAIGKANETKRKVLALVDADEASKAALDELRKENQDKLDVLGKASSNEMEKIKQANAQQIDRLTHAHQALVDSLKSTHSGEIERLSSEHSGLLDRLNAANNANINEIERRRQQEIQEIKGEGAATLSTLKGEHQSAIQAIKAEHQGAIETLRADHERAVQQLQRDHERRLAELEQRQAQEVARLGDRVAELQAERGRLSATIAELEQTLNTLRDEIKEGKLKNMFSVSKSGEKLIRVVRSVQELASELDETSRTVTGGEYSFFDQIKDQRDRDTVLSLAGGGQASAGEPIEEAPVAAPEVVDDEPERDVMGSWMDAHDEESGEAKAQH